MAIHFNITNSGRNHVGKSFQEDTNFSIGFATSYLGNIGLMHNRPQEGCIYRPEDYVAEHGFWAHFINPTAMCESKGSFLCLNTYDRAKFTYSFMQYAAHVPNGDFVKYFRRLLQLPLAQEYFPELAIENGRIVLKKLEGTSVPLENSQSTQALMDYLNPTLDAVDGPEQLSAARFIHWTINDAAHRKLQVAIAVEHMREAMANYSRRYDLNGVPDAVCLLICDIRHQGRAKSSQIIDAMNTNRDYRKATLNLLDLGKEHFPERIKTLKRMVQQYVDEGILAKKKYDEAKGDFVDL